MIAPYATSEPAFQVPDDLTELDRWLLWRYEQVEGRETKVPYSVRGYKASTTNPQHWAPYDAALAAWRKNPQRYTGLGFVFVKNDGLVGIDLDDALDADGNVKPQFVGLVEKFTDSYTEISPSGAGLKIWARGALPENVAGVKIGDGAIELYAYSRYFAVTGRRFRNAPMEVADHRGDLLRLHDRLTASKRRLVALPGGKFKIGEQHNRLIQICGALRRHGVCDEAVLACLLEVNERQCTRPGPRTNIERIVNSSRRWDRASAR